MQTPDFSKLGFLPSTSDRTLRLWVALAVSTLGLAGLDVLVLLAGRGSAIADKAIILQTFHDFLVVHVNLSAVAWFLGLSLLFWSFLSHGRPSPVPYLRGGALGTFAAGCLAIAVAPLMQDGQPLQSNYIPVYTSALFFFGIGLLASSLVLGLIDLALSGPLRGNPLKNTDAACAYGILGSAYIVLLALGHFLWAYLRVPVPQVITDGGESYYELLFWAGGHILQFAYTQLLLLAWLMLASAAGLKLPLRPVWLVALFSLYPLAASISPIAFLKSVEPYDLHFFTMQMRHGGGLAATPLGLYLLWALLRHGKPARERLVPWLCLVCSFAMFLLGGVIGFAIEGSSTVIPGHYHGSVVGTTVAFMGVIYLLLPKIGWADISQRRLALWQPLLYCLGSACHAVGLAIAGTYGAQRKTAGNMDGLPDIAVKAMKIGRDGGGLAILGGAFFVALVVISYRNRDKSTPA